LLPLPMVIPAPVMDSADGASIRQEHWLQRWYPVAYLQDLDPRRPTAFTLLEMDLVLWWDAAAVEHCLNRHKPKDLTMRLIKSNFQKLERKIPQP
jgi:hypothetical protein